MKKFMNEFREFALKGNVITLAVGFIIGGAFQGVVTSLTENILSPIIGLFAGHNFDFMQVEFFGVTLKYGAFLTSVINFVIMAFVVFLLVRFMNRLLGAGKKKPAPPPSTKKCPYCASDIPLAAIRCPQCTSQIENSDEKGE